MKELETTQLPSSSSGEGEFLSLLEQTIVWLVAQGVPDPVIATELRISEAQVRDHLVEIFKKLALAGLLDQLVYVGEEPPKTDS
ncbi:MAG: LuxR C-terminal-related transcriptional regulator [Acidobacteriia bacterium]|nr:LuxR C-terminal-related transcriptional regulator [Terriglobia bacterium]